MTTKTCKSTLAVTGCGQEKPDVEFQRTKHGRMKICSECLQKHRNKVTVIRFKRETTEETDLYNQLIKLWR